MGAPVSRGEPNASYFIDGVFVSGSISTAVTGAVERVEVLRGPQSAQFGRATFAGAVNYVTKKPTDTFQGEINGRSGTHDDHGVSGWASGPIGDSTFSYLVSGSWSEYGGQWRNQLEAGEPALNPQNGGRSRAGRLRLRCAPAGARISRRFAPDGGQHPARCRGDHRSARQAGLASVRWLRGQSQVRLHQER